VLDGGVADGRPAAGVLVVGCHVANCGMKPDGVVVLAQGVELARQDRAGSGWRLVGPTRSFDRKPAAGGEWGCIPTLEVVMRSPGIRPIVVASGGNPAEAPVRARRASTQEPVGEQVET
jgi:hypothetical protein